MTNFLGRCTLYCQSFEDGNYQQKKTGKGNLMRVVMKFALLMSLSNIFL